MSAGVTETAIPAPRLRHVRAVSELMPKVGGAAFRRFGFMHSQIVARWSDIVGEDYARHSTPEGLKFPLGKRSGGTLSVLVTGAFAPMLRHVEPQVIERANRFFGYAAVARLALRHGDLPATGKRRLPPPAADLAPGTQATLKDIADPELRGALESLAHALAGSSGLPVIR